jgi:hypothetical protein
MSVSSRASVVRTSALISESMAMLGISDERR